MENYLCVLQFHQVSSKSDHEKQKVLIIAHFSVQNFKVPVELWKSYIVQWCFELWKLPLTMFCVSFWVGFDFIGFGFSGNRLHYYFIVTKCRTIWTLSSGLFISVVTSILKFLFINWYLQQVSYQRSVHRCCLIVNKLYVNNLFL